MKAIVYSEYGSADVLHVAERERPVVRPGEILLRVRAVEATKADCELRSFQFPVKWFSWPLRLVFGWRRPKKEILGAYCAGTVEAVGEGVTRFAVGDEVFGATQFRFGGYGEYVSVPETYTMTRKPENMSFEEAAAVPLGGLNAIHFMRRAQVKPGERMLINGAGGSIGSFALQIARHMGAHVTAVDAPHKGEMLRDLGADVVIDYTREDFAESGQQYDIVFDMVADNPLERGLRVLRPGGRYLTGNPTFRKMLATPLVSLFSKKDMIFAFADEKLEELESLRDLIEAGAVRSALDQVLPLENAVEAHRRVESEQRAGIVVLKVA